MSDLISRNDVIQILKECNLDETLFEKDVFDKIRNLPTAYDVDTVIGDLYGLKRYKNKYDSYYENSMYQLTKLENDTINSTIDKAIKIVKAGGNIDE